MNLNFRLDEKLFSMKEVRYAHESDHPVPDLRPGLLPRDLRRQIQDCRQAGRDRRRLRRQSLHVEGPVTRLC
jgi:hypothetical protein